MIPFNPEPLEELKARYPKAIEELYNQVDVARGLQARPNGRHHIFDFNDGIRLIVSKEKEPESKGGRIVIHISGSAHTNKGAAQYGLDTLLLKLDDTLIHHIVEHFALLIGRTDIQLELKMITNEIIAHFYWRWDN